MPKNTAAASGKAAASRSALPVPLEFGAHRPEGRNHLQHRRDPLLWWRSVPQFGLDVIDGVIERLDVVLG